METVQKKLIDFGELGEKENWRVVNDGVMGGLSQSEMVITENKTAIFKGTVSLKNSGGFASVGTYQKKYRLAEYDGIGIRIKGDGKKYQLRLRIDDRYDGIAYHSDFHTVSSEWIEVNLPFNGFLPTFRGREVPDAPELDPGKIQQIGFLIADNQEGDFRLEIDWIGAYTETEPETQSEEVADEISLSEYLWKNRLLLIFSPSGSYTDYADQKQDLVKQKAEVEDRDLVIFTILEEGKSHVDESPISNETAESLRKQFDVKPGQFTVILIGKDGGEKLRAESYKPIEEIFSLIDSMPMRQAEIRKRKESR